MGKIKTIITGLLILLFFITILIGSKCVKAQKIYKPSTLELKGYIYEGDEKAVGVLIELYQNGTIVEKKVTKSNYINTDYPLIYC